MAADDRRRSDLVVVKIDRRRRISAQILLELPIGSADQKVAPESRRACCAVLATQDPQ